MALIKPFKVPKKKEAARSHGGRRIERRRMSEEQEPYSVEAVTGPERPDLVNFLLEMGRERGELEERVAVLAKERGRVASWGEFDPADFAYMAERGVSAFLYELSPEAFRNLPEATRFVRVGEGKSSVRIMVLDAPIPDLRPFTLPAKPLSAIDAELAEAAEKLAALNVRMKGFADRRPVLERIMAGIQMEADFGRAKAELERVEGLPEHLGVSYLTGFVPAAGLGAFRAEAAKNGWALAADDPGEEDLPPTQLKNNAVTGLISPLTGFLELLPGYRERDASGWFLLFVTIFFGMILGDAAYGLIFLLIALIGMARTARTGVPVALKMLLLFAVGNVAWGTITASWFAVDYKLLPPLLLSLSLPQLTTATGTSQTVVNQNMQVFCFSLALVHLCIARIGGFLRGIRERDMKCLADLGSAGMLYGMYRVILSLVVSAERFPIGTDALYALGGGFALSFLFSYYEKNPIQAILGSLKNIFPVVLGVTGIFSDIMSYIRLWAVGLAGFALAGAFNSMAGPMLGSFLIFGGMLILAAGHGLNLALNTLSVLVHGVRLNILEFSGHARLTWSGIPYRPFAEPGAK